MAARRLLRYFRLSDEKARQLSVRAQEQQPDAHAGKPGNLSNPARCGAIWSFEFLWSENIYPYSATHTTDEALFG